MAGGVYTLEGHADLDEFNDAPLFEHWHDQDANGVRDDTLDGLDATDRVLRAMREQIGLCCHALAVSSKAMQATGARAPR